MMEEVIRYIIRFLCYGNESAAQQVRYVKQLDSDVSYPLTIVGNEMDLPIHYPYNTEPQVERLANGHYVIRTDVVYNTFFFISRAEELINPQRDQYGRFLARYSRYDSAFWSSAMIDEYSRLVLQLLNIPMPKAEFAAIHLTHDIDTLTQYRHLRGAMGGLCRGQWKQVWAAWHNINNDPAYTFPWMMEQDAGCRMHHAQCDVIYFAKDTSGKGIDYPQYNLRGKDYRATVDLLQHSGAQLGIHSSAYDTFPLPEGKLHRSHYLSCSIERMQQLVEAGYTDDYTMGFADLAGFRLQTTRAVRWINPLTLHLSPLTLHPLTIMDCSLSNQQYMNLSEDEAYTYAAQLIDNVRMYHGELNLLWHNSNFNPNTYHTSLYPKILQLI